MFLRGAFIAFLFEGSSQQLMRPGTARKQTHALLKNSNSFIKIAFFFEEYAHSGASSKIPWFQTQDLAKFRQCPGLVFLFIYEIRKLQVSVGKVRIQ